MQADAKWAFKQYENIRSALPSAAFPSHSKHIGSLAELADNFDVFLLDAFGVLNLGKGPIASAPAQVSTLQAMGKQVLVLTNGATLPADAAQEKFKRYGFDFSLNDIISSRGALAQALPQNGKRWGAIAASTSRIEELPVDCILLGHSPSEYDEVDGFLILSAAEWENDQQKILFQSLAKNPRPVLCGNPDIVAPREYGLSLQPGHYAHQLNQIPGVRVAFFGKPFPNIYSLALQHFSTVPKSRVLMVGDTLHTDILGGAAAGIKTALITDHGVYAGQDTNHFIQASGIRPDFILPTI